MSTQRKLAEDSVFAGRYRINRFIAAGAMGSVYEVTHIETERRRALKVLHPEIVANEDLRARFRQEAKVTAAIESDFLVDVYDAGIDETTGLPFLVMEMLRGEELSDRIARVGAFDPTDALVYLHQLSLALDKTKKASIVHRDLKPENIFLTEREDGRPHLKVLDFGIAKIVAEGTQHKATRNLGTPVFMAPEQFRPGAGVTPATDIFALGMISFKLLVGSDYWLDETEGNPNVFEFVPKALKGPQESARARAERRGVPLPEAFDPWFAKMTAFLPTDRFDKASEAIEALAVALDIPHPTKSTAVAASPATAGAKPPEKPPAEGNKDEVHREEAPANDLTFF